MENKYTFNDIANEYDKHRPCYPKELFDDILNYSSATAFHFIDSMIGYPKVSKLLKHNGTIGFFGRFTFHHMKNYIQKSGKFIECMPRNWMIPRGHLQTKSYLLEKKSFVIQTYSRT